MPFEIRNLASLGQQTRRGDAMQVFTYKSTVDKLADVLVPGYFDNGFLSNTGCRALVSVGDVLLCSLADGMAQIRISQNENGVIDAMPVGFNQRTRRIAVSIGDSTINGTATVVPTALSHVDGLVTVTAAGHSVMTGSRIFVTRCDQEEFNGLTRVLSSDSGGFTYRVTGRKPAVDSATSAIGFQVRMLDAWSGTNVMAVASAMAGAVFDDIVCLSQGSETAAQTAARFDDALALNPAVIEIGTGINSINTDVPVDTIFAQLREMYRKGMAAGAIVFARTVGPLGSAHVNYTTARLGAINRLNRMIRHFVWAHSDRMELVDVFETWVNPTNTSGDWISGYSTDAIHSLSKATWFQAKKTAPRLSARFGRIPWQISSVTDDIVDDASSLNLFEFGLRTGNAGTITAATGNSGTIGDGLSATVIGSPVTTVNTHGIARADGIGFNDRCVITTDAANEGINFPATSATIHQRVDDYPGREIQLGVNFLLTTSDVDTANVQWSFNITENSVIRSVNGMNGLVIPAGETADLWFITPPVPIPSGTLGSCRPRLSCTLAGAGEATILHGRYFMQVLPLVE